MLSLLQQRAKKTNLKKVTKDSTEVIQQVPSDGGPLQDHVEIILVPCQGTLPMTHLCESWE